MEIYTKSGERVLNLGSYGYEWGMTFVKGGADEVLIDTGDASAFSDFIATLKEYSDLSAKSITELEDNFFDDKNWAIEVEDGARECLADNGYVAQNDYYFVAKNIIDGERY